MHFLANFFTGAFLCNCIPHLAAGLMGMPFPSPFSKPPGIGDSSPLVNFLWGLVNLLAGGYLFLTFPFALTLNPGFLTTLLGAVLLGVWISIHFGKVRQNKHA
ncbi:hypothetical protein [Nevskia soli]|uniref:hypothetical protein n=1 Tax=Nevskia soli TaxID=418856 RepID=UPI0004A76ED6|nr:hypothetical protein [Nevskia soli]